MQRNESTRFWWMVQQTRTGGWWTRRDGGGERDMADYFYFTIRFVLLQARMERFGKSLTSGVVQNNALGTGLARRQCKV